MALRFIELDGSVGVPANGAGPTMTIIEAVRHCGGEPANCPEIGGAMEEAAADDARTMDEPIVACIAGTAGATVVATPTEIAPALKALLG